MSKPILISISPNAQADDVWLALRTLINPLTWKTGVYNQKLINQLKQYFKLPNCYLFNAARSALFIGLKSLNLKPKDQVLYQKFTCSVVPQAILKAKAKPIPVNHTSTYNLDVKDLQNKITPQSKALIIQHTFGNPDDLGKIKDICKKHQLTLIEDCAHALGTTYQKKPVGSFGDMTVLSFGRDKVISSVFGGALLSKKKIPPTHLSNPSNFWVSKQLLHPIIMSLAVPTYFSLGKFIIGAFRALKLITLPLNNLPIQSMPNGLARLALHQWSKLDQFNQHRKKLAKIYCDAFNSPFNPDGIYLRFPLKVNNPKALISYAKKHQVFLGNWYDHKIVNLPTHIRMTTEDAKRIVKIVKTYANH